MIYLIIPTYSEGQTKGLDKYVLEGPENLDLNHFKVEFAKQYSLGKLWQANLKPSTRASLVNLVTSIMTRLKQDGYPGEFDFRMVGTDIADWTAPFVWWLESKKGFKRIPFVQFGFGKM
jgi:hypothetical protein